MKTPGSRITGYRGFTLIEILIITVIVGVVAAQAAPSLQTVYTRHAFKSGYKEMVSDLREARSHAISNNVPCGVYFDQEAMSMTLFENLSNPASTAFDSGDSVLSVDTLPHVFSYFYADFDNSSLVFQPNGSAQLNGYGNIYLAGEDGYSSAYFSTNILASTGRINSYSQFYTW